jgi:hypothetical protein
MDRGNFIHLDIANTSFGLIQTDTRVSCLNGLERGLLHQAARLNCNHHRDRFK